MYLFNLKAAARMDILELFYLTMSLHFIQSPCLRLCGCNPPTHVIWQLMVCAFKMHHKYVGIVPEMWGTSMHVTENINDREVETIAPISVEIPSKVQC